MKNKIRSRALVALFSSAWMALAQAGQFDEVVGRTVLTNPDVLAKFHQFQAALHERDVSRGRYLPTLDVNYGIGHEHRESPLYTSPTGERRYQFRESRAILRQNLFDGLGTTHDVERLGHASMVRFYEMHDLSEQAAYDAVKAYLDVLRYRQLVAFAEENYATHRLLYEKIKERAMSGVGRKVDLESAGGRLALAESNLVTESANLHDVMARFQRIVGALPGEALEPPSPSILNGRMPEDQATAINASFANSPQLKAALENIYAAHGQVRFASSAYAPRFDAFLEKRRDEDVSGYPGTTNSTTFGLTVSWNLFNGQRDVGRQRQVAEERNQSKDLREKVCREVRQNAAMAFNDYYRLRQQLPLLDQHQLSTDKAREAFRRQFDIGQRTLLDVLDTENEYYTARRNYQNGETDMTIAQFRYLAVAGKLLESMKLSPIEAKPLSMEAPTDAEIPEMCPAEPVHKAVEPVIRPTNYVVLLNNPDGSTGKVIIRGSAGQQEVVQAGTAVPLDGSKAPVAVSDEQIQQDFGATMAARPALPEEFTLNFERGGVRVSPSSEESLKRLMASIARHPVAEIEVVGHTDTLGSLRSNDALGLKRAQFIAERIRAAGVQVRSLSVASRGERDLLVNTPDNTAEPRNRRADVRVR